LLLSEENQKSGNSEKSPKPLKLQVYNQQFKRTEKDQGSLPLKIFYLVGSQEDIILFKHNIISQVYAIKEDHYKLHLFLERQKMQ